MAIQQVWALVQTPINTSRHGKVGSGNTKQNICYRVAPTASELWDAILEEEFLGSGQTKSGLQKLGWQAKPVMLIAGD